MSPPNVEAPGLAVGTSGRALMEADATIVRNAGDDDKRFANLCASACLAGHELHRHSDGRLEARRWGWHRTFANLDEVETWLAQVTGEQPFHRERARRELIDAANRRQDQLDEAADFLRGPGEVR